mgnify:CR=1 FL=1
MFHWHIGVLTNSIDSSMKALQGLGVDTSRWLFGIADFSGDQTAVGTSGKLRSAVGRIGGVVYECPPCGWNDVGRGNRPV